MYPNIGIDQNLVGQQIPGSMPIHDLQQINNDKNILAKYIEKQMHNHNLNKSNYFNEKVLIEPLKFDEFKVKVDENEVVAGIQ